MRTLTRVLALACLLSGLALTQTKDVAPRGLVSTSFSNLGTPANGTIAYCADCASTNPATGGGTGAVVRREGGVWNGGGGSTGSLLFGALLSGTNNAAAMTIGSGAALTYSGTGFINANRILGTSFTSVLGNGGKLPQASGSFSSGNVLSTDLTGNIIDSGVVAANLVTAATTLTSGLPLIGGGGSIVGLGTRQGNTAKYVSYAGAAPSTNDCAKFDASGNLVTASAACGGSVTWSNISGVVVTGTAAKFLPLSGMLITTANNPAGTFEAQFGPDTAIMLARDRDQAGTDTYCRSTTGNDTYTCTLAPTLGALTRGMRIVLDADTANTGAATLAIDGLTAKSILTRSGAALVDGDIPANKPIDLTYDGTQFILQSGAATGGGPSLATANTIYPLFDYLGATGASAICTLAAPCYWGFANPFSGGLKVTNISMVGNVGQGSKDGIVYFMDRSCNLVAGTTSTTNTNAGPGNTILTFVEPSPPTLTGDFYYLGLATTCTTCSIVVTGASNAYTLIINNLGTSFNFQGNTAATQGGGAGTAITAPATCGTRSTMAGAAANPPVALVTN